MCSFFTIQALSSLHCVFLFFGSFLLQLRIFLAIADFSCKLKLAIPSSKLIAIFFPSLLRDQCC